MYPWKRQDNKQTQVANGSDSSNNNTASDNSNNNNNSSTTTMDVQGGEDEDALLQQALQMSMAASYGRDDNSMDVVNDKDDKATMMMKQHN